MSKELNKLKALSAQLTERNYILSTTKKQLYRNTAQISVDKVIGELKQFLNEHPNLLEEYSNGRAYPWEGANYKAILYDLNLLIKKLGN